MNREFIFGLIAGILFLIVIGCISASLSNTSHCQSLFLHANCVYPNPSSQCLEILKDANCSEFHFNISKNDN